MRGDVVDGGIAIIGWRAAQHRILLTRDAARDTGVSRGIGQNRIVRRTCLAPQLFGDRLPLSRGDRQDRIFRALRHVANLADPLRSIVHLLVRRSRCELNFRRLFRPGCLRALGGLRPWLRRLGKLYGFRFRSERELRRLFRHGRRRDALRRSGGEAIDEGKRRLAGGNGFRHGWRRIEARVARAVPRYGRASCDVDPASRERRFKIGAPELRIRIGGKNVGVNGPAATEDKSDHRRRGEQTLRRYFAGWSLKCRCREIVTRNATDTHPPESELNPPRFPKTAVRSDARCGTLERRPVRSSAEPWQQHLAEARAAIKATFS